MVKTSSNLLVSVLDQVAYIKVTGRANFASSVNFKMLVNELKERGYNKFVLELGECVTMDSTFLGVLAGLVLKYKDGPEPVADDICLQLQKPNQRIVDLLENLGVAHLFDNVSDTEPCEASFEPSAQGDIRPTREEISETCLEAHKTLMRVNPDNIPKFKEVAQFLAEDLKKLKA
jgi:anti-sigma B factor antagonist